MRVGLVTGFTNERCGMTEYAKNIMRNVHGVDFKVIPDTSDAGMLAGATDCDIVHISYEYNVVTVTPQGIRDVGKPVLMTYINSNPDSNNRGLTNACARVVVLEPTKDSDPKYTYIPMAIPEGQVAMQEPENLVGAVGFPFQWKRMPAIAEAANYAGMGFLGVMPTHPWDVGGCNGQQQEAKRVCPNSQIFTEWLTFEEVMGNLGRCKVICFAPRHIDGSSGVSSSVRYGLAVGRPIVLTDFLMYRDLLPYSDEINFVPMSYETPQLGNALLEAAKGEKKPNRVLKDLSWKTAGEQYKKIYEEMAA